MIADIEKECKERMQKSIQALETAFTKVRTGRAHPSLLDNVVLDYYGVPTPLNQMAQVGIEDARTLMVRPFEKKSIPDVEKAIMTSGLGLNPVTSGDVVRIPMPPLTEETRKNMTKIVRQEAEQARISLRNIRRDANAELKEFLKEKEISEDDDRQGQERVQKLTDQFVDQVAKLLQAKEADLMEI